MAYMKSRTKDGDAVKSAAGEGSQIDVPAPYTYVSHEPKACAKDDTV